MQPGGIIASLWQGYIDIDIIRRGCCWLCHLHDGKAWPYTIILRKSHAVQKALKVAQHALVAYCGQHAWHNLCHFEREREKLHYVHSASLAYEDGSVFMPGPCSQLL